MVASLSNLLHVLVLALAAAIASIPFVAAQTNPIIDELNGKISPTPPPPGYNVEGTSVFTNFARAFDEKQFFLLGTGSWVYEKPGSEPMQFTLLDWCGDLTFSDISNSSIVGYSARCVLMVLAGYAEAQAAGAQLIYQYSEGEWIATKGISAVYVEQLNVFEGQVHENTDDWVNRFWDDGRKTAPMVGWEGHDEGDMASNAATSSFSNFGEITWMSVEEVAQLFNTSVDEFTPVKFKQVYLDTWIKTHKEEAAEKNPNAEAELAIIEQVKNETDSAGGTMSPAEPDTEEDGGTDAANPVEEEDSASGRKLTSVAARFVSASLRVFGI